MPISVEPVIQSVLTRLSGTLSNVTILDVEDENEVVVGAGGFVKPYVVVSFTNPLRMTRDRTLGPSAHDTNQMGCVVHCVASTSKKSREIRDQVNNALVDFYPEDGGRMTLDGGGQYQIAATSSLPKRYATATYLRFAQNLSFS